MFKLSILLVAVAAVWGLPRGGSKIEAQTRIIGGHGTDIASHPHQLRFVQVKPILCIDEITVCGELEEFLCGAVMIGSRWALTAAHCTYKLRRVDGTFMDGLQVVAGTNNKYTGGQHIPVANVYQHPQFAFYPAPDYDISVLELAKDITIVNASPIALHDAGYVAKEHSLATATGWGYLNALVLTSDILQVVVDQVVSNEYCDRSYNGKITDRMVCAGNMRDGGGNTCGFDSGGPLVVDDKLYGITSWGGACDIPGLPGVYSRISEQSIREFIRNKTGI